MNNISIEDYLDNILMPKLVQETAKILNQSQDELKQIQWTIGEANTDKQFSLLAGKKAQEAFKKVHSQSNFSITIQTTTPDLKIKFIVHHPNQKSKTYSRKIELKSGTTNIIPGSTIRKLDLNCWVIFVLRQVDNSQFSFRYGRYHKGLLIKDTDLFQDRTPRPSLKWDNYQTIDESPNIDKVENNKEWISRYAKAAIYRVFYASDLKFSWQDDLVRLIIKYVLEDEKILNKALNQLEIDQDELMEKLSRIMN
jgi:hypothetical protein